MSRPPTWRNATIRAAVAAVLFGVLLLAFRRPVATSLVMIPVVFIIYVPLGYATDVAIYRFRQRRKNATAGAKDRRG